MFNKRQKNQKAQIGETMTWVVATLIIIIILAFSIFISSFYLGKNKDVAFDKRIDPIAFKSMFSYLLTSDNDDKVFDQLKEEDNLNEFNGNLALSIFETFYKKDYPVDVWLGFVVDRTLLPFIRNNYFGLRPTNVRGGDVYHHSVSYISERIKLNENKSLELVLMKK